jgi:hypothetical protein
MGRPKQLTPPKEVFHVRLPEDRTNALKSEADTRGGSPSEVIRLHLDRYAEIAWRDLPSLSDNAWCAVFEALGAVTPIPVWCQMSIRAECVEPDTLPRRAARSRAPWFDRGRWLRVRVLAAVTSPVVGNDAGRATAQIYGAPIIGAAGEHRVRRGYAAER